MAKSNGEEKKAGAELRPIASNRRARFEYEILDTFEAGLALRGPEVKSLREGKGNLNGAFAIVRRGEVWLIGCQIAHYAQASRDNSDPLRERKLLLHKSEIARLEGKIAERGFTLVPLSLYFKAGRAKVELAVARGKKTHDKREAIKQREDRRAVDRALSNARKRG
ncbi:MAG TPA: SsrA-binding protein SmpB [Myxococcota bacterium]|jgi:SsrA-binding protein